MNNTVANYSDYEAEERGARFAGGWVTWFIGALVVAAVVAFSSTPSGYVVEMPGEVHDTLGTVEIDGDTVPLVDIPMEETFPTTGSLSMLTVSTLGDRERTALWSTVIAAWLDRSQAVLPVDEVFPADVTSDELSEYSAAQMAQSQKTAVAAALTVLGHEYTKVVSVFGTMGAGPSDGVLLAGDVITAVNSVAVPDVPALRAQLDANGLEKAAVISILRAGVAQDVSITPIADDNVPIIGINTLEEYDFPFDVSIQLEGIGGPSAGHIFALAIIDKLTPGPLTGGKDVAGTGTISEDGTIGAIGGIRQKMYGAVSSGADYFLAPAANCDQVVGAIPDGLTVFAVSTLADSLAVLNTLSTGASTALLARCES